MFNQKSVKWSFLIASVLVLAACGEVGPSPSLSSSSASSSTPNSISQSSSSSSSSSSSFSSSSSATSTSSSSSASNSSSTPPSSNSSSSSLSSSQPPVQYTITFKNYDDSVLSTQTVNQGSTVVYSGPTPTRPSTSQYTYTFTGWDRTLTNITSSFTTKAEFTSTTNTYTVTWQNHDGTTLETDSNVPYGTTPTYDGATPIKTGNSQYSYSFSGWTPSISSVTTNITHTAQYSESTNGYTITWQNHEGTVLETDTDVPYGTTPTYDGVTPVRTGSAQFTYSFTGWSPTVTSVTSNATYTAQFSSTTNSYTITWQNYDGTTLETDTDVPYGTTPTYEGETPLKSDEVGYFYIFLVWNPTPSLVTKDVTYYAEFIKSLKTYSLHYELDGGTNSSLNPTSYNIESEDTILNQPIKNGYSFAGWFLNIEYSEQITMISQGTIGDIRVYAKWNPIEYLVTLNDIETNPAYSVNFISNGTILSTQNVTSSSGLVYPQIPTRNNYAFRGWFEDAGCTRIFDLSKKMNTDTNVYAGWHKMISQSAAVGYGMATQASIWRDLRTSASVIIESYGPVGFGGSSSKTAYTTFFNSGTFQVEWKSSTSFSDNNDYGDFSMGNATTGTIYRNGKLVNANAGITYKYSVTVNAGDIFYCNVKSYDFNNSNIRFSISGITTPSSGGRAETSPLTQKINFGSEFSFPVPLNTGQNFLGWYGIVNDNEIQFTNSMGIGLFRWNYSNEITLYGKWAASPS
jgi:uncharacterized repeat protein (TIGR02543 family)